MTALRIVDDRDDGDDLEHQGAYGETGPVLCALCDNPEGDTQWSKFVPFRGTIAHAGCSLDIDSSMADDYLARVTP